MRKFTVYFTLRFSISKAISFVCLIGYKLLLSGILYWVRNKFFIDVMPCNAEKVKVKTTGSSNPLTLLTYSKFIASCWFFRCWNRFQSLEAKHCLENRTLEKKLKTWPNFDVLTFTSITLQFTIFTVPTIQSNWSHIWSQPFPLVVNLSYIYLFQVYLESNSRVSHLPTTSFLQYSSANLL